MKRLHTNRNSTIRWSLSKTVLGILANLRFGKTRATILLLVFLFPILLIAQAPPKSTAQSSSSAKLCNLLTQEEVANAFGWLEPNIVKVEVDSSRYGFPACFYWYSYYEGEEAKPDFSVAISYGNEKPLIDEFKYIKDAYNTPSYEPKPEPVPDLGKEAYWRGSNELIIQLKDGKILLIRHFSHHDPEFLKKVSIKLANIAIKRIK